MANRIEVDVRTGQQSTITLTSDEEADAAARSAAEANDPKRREYVAQKQLLTDAKALVIFRALERASLVDIDTWVDANFSGMSIQQRAFLKMVAAGIALYLRERNGS